MSTELQPTNSETGRTFDHLGIPDGLAVRETLTWLIVIADDHIAQQEGSSPKSHFIKERDVQEMLSDANFDPYAQIYTAAQVAQIVEEAQQGTVAQE